MYKQKLIALLEGLECECIPELILRSCEHLRQLGEEIAKAAKFGSAAYKASDICVKKCEFDRHGYCAALCCYSSQECGGRDANGHPRYQAKPADGEKNERFCPSCGLADYHSVVCPFHSTRRG